MTYDQMLDIVFDKMKEKNPSFSGFSQETASMMACAFTVMAAVGKNSLDELAFIDKNANVVTIPFGANPDRVNEKAKAKATNDGDSSAK